jgi:PAS domain S-box-containing protein
MAYAGQNTEEAQQAQDVDAIPTLAWSARPDGSAEFLNQRWLDYTGLSAEEASHWGWTAALHPDERDGLLDFWRSVLASGKRGEIAGRLRYHDGGYRWFLFRAEPFSDENGKIVRWYGTNTDIEDLKQAEHLLAAEKHTLEMIADGASLNDILNHVCTSMDLLVAPSMTTILLMDPDGKRLWHTAGPRVPREWVPIISPLQVAIEAGLCGTAAFLKERIVVPDVATDPNWPDQLRLIAIKNGIRAGWSQPIVTKDRQVLGTFAVYSPESRVPTDADLALIEGAGRIVQIAIERQRSQEALRNASEEIRNSEAKLRKIIDTIPTLAWCSLPDGTGIFWNRRWHEYTGLTLEVVRGWGWQDAIHPEDLKEITAKWLGFLASGQPGEVEGRLRRFDGVYRWFLFRAEPLRDKSGNIVNWYGTDTDIDDLKRVEAKVRQDERELRQLLDFLPQHVVVLDKDGTLLQANKTLLDYKGLTLEQMKTAGTGERISRDVHPEDLEKFEKERSAGLSKGRPFEMEKRLLGKDGRYRWFLVRCNPVLNDDGDVVRWFAMFEEIVGSSEALRRVLAQLSKVAPTDSTVLISGETGTGKELIARAIHNRSHRSTRAFIRVNCAAISPSLIASELFGHERGSFTGAHQRRLGRFESADGGTIFLDEVAEIPPETQVALLRVLQEREFERVGGNQTVPVDVRVLAATNKDLRAAVADGTFRQDLFYRLNVFPIQVPALRDRVEDIPLLVEYLVDRYAKKAGKRIRSVSKDTLNLFQSYNWPGNIRELQNVVERAVVLCDGDIFCVDPSWLTPVSSSPTSLHPTTQTIPLVADLAEREKAMIEDALREAEGLISGPNGAAAKLGIPRQTLESKIRKLGIKRRGFTTS